MARFLYGLVFILVCLAIAYALTVGFPGLDHLLCGGEGTGC